MQQPLARSSRRPSGARFQSHRSAWTTAFVFAAALGATSISAARHIRPFEGPASASASPAAPVRASYYGPSVAQGSEARGQVETITVHGPSLAGNLLGDTADPHVTVYLPPGYAAHPRRHYPVLYLLHGFIGSNDSWFKDAISEQDKRPIFPLLLDDGIARGTLRPLIVVAPNAFNTFHGSFYSTSIATGDWESYVAHDLPNYIDAHYRTIATAAGRGLAGHSMGGYGALRIGFRHPETFSSIYALSPFGVTWGGDFQPTPNPSITALDAIHTKEQLDKLDFNQLAILALAAAWSPDPFRPPFFLDLPGGAGQSQIDTVARWSANLILPQVDQNLPRILQLHAIAFDVGIGDNVQNIPLGLAALDHALTQRKVAHTYETFEGAHANRLAERLATRVLPFFSRNLSFEPGTK
jgi:enterochelin esterase-like enzyme